MALALTKKNRESIKTQVSVLLGNARYGYPCPIDDVNRIEVWHRLLPVDMVRSYETLRTYQFDLNYITQNMVHFYTYMGHDKIKVTFLSHSGSKATHNSFLWNRSLDRGGALTFQLDNVALAAGISREYISTWITNCVTISRDFAGVLHTLEQVLEFCGTMGQLKRAIPDLVNYLPRDTQKLLASQTRASNMPHEWAGFDRSMVDRLQAAMAKASLFPEPTDVRTREYGSIQNTWAEYIPGA